MGFKRLTTLCCDGPCGTAIKETEKAPAGWVKLMVTEYEVLAQGQKPSKTPLVSWMCEKCWNRLQDLIRSAHFNLSGGLPTESKEAANVL